MNIIIDEKHFPLHIISPMPISDEKLLQIREANKMLHIERLPNGELFVKPTEAVSGENR